MLVKNMWVALLRACFVTNDDYIRCVTVAFFRKLIFTHEFRFTKQIGWKWSELQFRQI